MTHLLLARTKLTEAEILKIMSSANCIYRAEDAVRWGLVDEIVSDEGGAQPTRQSQPSSVRRANLEFYEALETEAASLNPNIRVTDDFDSYLASNIEKRLKLLRQNGNTTVTFQFENTMDGLTDTSRRKAVVLAFRIISLLRHFNATAIIQTAVSSGALLAIACNRRLIRPDGMLVLHATMLDFPSAVIGSDGKVPEGEFRQGLSAQRAVESFLRRRTRLKDSDLRSCMAPGCTGQVSARAAIELGMADEVITS
jgi:ATP-dependent protease ClpP protease subunit